MIKVILCGDVAHLGVRGQEITVKDGYARNFLFPRGLACEATEKNRMKVEKQKEINRKEHNKVLQKYQQMKEQIERLSLTIAVKVGEAGKMFGSVTAADVAEGLCREGFSVDKKDIILEENIKEPGVYTVAVRLHQDIEASVKLWIVKE